jgi:G:T/U-mismatch repair DNA glycosylase
LAILFLSCERIGRSSLDTRLTDIEYNKEDIVRVLDTRKISKILFTSKFVEAHFKRYFKEIITKYPNVELITLPSPSPRYASMSKEEKIKRYSQELPKIKN